MDHWIFQVPSWIFQLHFVMIAILFWLHSLWNFTRIVLKIDSTEKINFKNLRKLKTLKLI